MEIIAKPFYIQEFLFRLNPDLNFLRLVNLFFFLLFKRRNPILQINARTLVNGREKTSTDLPNHNEGACQSIVLQP